MRGALSIYRFISGLVRLLPVTISPLVVKKRAAIATLSNSQIRQYAVGFSHLHNLFLRKSLQINRRNLQILMP